MNFLHETFFILCAAAARVKRIQKFFLLLFFLFARSFSLVLASVTDRVLFRFVLFFVIADPLRVLRARNR